MSIAILVLVLAERVHSDRREGSGADGGRSERGSAAGFFQEQPTHVSAETFGIPMQTPILLPH
jgi:hypothetical protein